MTPSTSSQAWVFLEPTWLLALSIAPVLGLLVIIAIAMSRRSVRKFFQAAANQPWVGRHSSGFRFFTGIFAIVGISALVIALARPAFDPKPRSVQRLGRDVVFLVDVSRSMLATDLRPTRLDRAKLMIRDALDVAEGDRIGVVAFAGAAVIKCPLTTDYAFTRLALDDVSPDSVGRGGTAIGDAIRTATSQLAPDESAKPDTSRSRVIILITDGEDHESNPLEAAQAAAAKGIRIVAIGVGSELVGSLVPAAEQSSRPNAAERTQSFAGKPVLTKQDPQALAAIAQATPGGVFFNVGTGNVEFDKLYTRLIRQSKAQFVQSAEAIKYTELFQVFLGAALLFLSITGIVQARRGWL